MCGRTIQQGRSNWYSPLLRVVRAEDSPGPDERYPGNALLAFHNQPAGRVLTPLTWGFLGPRGDLVYNARRETVATSRLWADAFAKRRCLVPVEGFYERGKALRANGVLLLAGIWQDDRLALLTGPATYPVSTLHPREPLALLAPDWEAWLDPARSSPWDHLVANHPSLRICE